MWRLKKTMKFIINQKITAIVGIIFLVGTFFLWNSFSSENQPDVVDINGKKAIVYKSPNCGCCVGYITYLKEQGFQVESINTKDMASLKDKYQIPKDMQSCHTVVIGDYFIEGHVPIEAVNKLLEEKPVLSGISLPGMLSGSAGMPGVKQKTFQVYGLLDGNISEFLNI